MSGQTADSAILFALSNEKSLRKTLTMNPDDKRECTKEPSRGCKSHRERGAANALYVCVGGLKLATWQPQMWVAAGNSCVCERADIEQTTMSPFFGSTHQHTHTHTTKRHKHAHSRQNGKKGIICWPTNTYNKCDKYSQYSHRLFDCYSNFCAAAYKVACGGMYISISMMVSS